MAKQDEDKCPPHNYVTTGTTTDSGGGIILAEQVCNKCGDTRWIRA